MPSCGHRSNADVLQDLSHRGRFWLRLCTREKCHAVGRDLPAFDRPRRAYAHDAADSAGPAWRGHSSPVPRDAAMGPAGPRSSPLARSILHSTLAGHHPGPALSSARRASRCSSIEASRFPTYRCPFGARTSSLPWLRARGLGATRQVRIEAWASSSATPPNQALQLTRVSWARSRRPGSLRSQAGFRRLAAGLGRATLLRRRARS